MRSKLGFFLNDPFFVSQVPFICSKLFMMEEKTFFNRSVAVNVVVGHEDKLGTMVALKNSN